MQQSMADMDADPPTTTTAALAPEIRERIVYLLRALNDRFTVEASKGEFSGFLDKALRNALGCKHKGDAVKRIKKLAIGIFHM